MGITICSGVGFLAAIGCAGLYDRKSSFLKPFVCGTVFYFFCYILWSMLLFVTNQFTLFRAVLGTAVVHPNGLDSAGDCTGGVAVDSDEE